jgi:hypothetical protein
MTKLGYHSAIIDAVSGGGKQATITVYESGTTDLATIYSNTSGGSLGNPFDTDSMGRFSLFVDSGVYDIQVSGLGIVTYKLEGISLLDFSVPSGDDTEIKNIYIDSETGKCEVEY